MKEIYLLDTNIISEVTKPIPSEKIISGSVCKIKVNADGYSEENFSLLFDWYQDELFVSANLQPVNNQ